MNPLSAGKSSVPSAGPAALRKKIGPPVWHFTPLFGIIMKISLKWSTKSGEKMKINYGEYLEKVYGCWAGKNIGGTLGAPMEGKMAMNNVTFYTQELNGVPAPNDDLDLQLIWLAAVEVNGIDQITPNLLGEYWQKPFLPPSSQNAKR